jgi:hypothetical protein
MIEHYLTVAGFIGDPHTIVQQLENQIYGKERVPRGYEVSHRRGRFEFLASTLMHETLAEFSKRMPDCTFLLRYGGAESRLDGQLVIRNGDVLEWIERIGGCYLFDAIHRPTVDIFEPYLYPTLTLRERVYNRLQDAITAIQVVVDTMEDNRFLASTHTPFSEFRDLQKTAKARADLIALRESMAAQISELDLEGVFLEKTELSQALPRNAAASTALMSRLGLEHALPNNDGVLGFSILPGEAAITTDPPRAILPVVHYLNPEISGKYRKPTDGSLPEINWKVCFACLTKFDTRNIRLLPDENQGAYDIDLISRSNDPVVGYAIERATNQALWLRNSDIAAEVRKSAGALSNILKAKAASQTGIVVFDSFEQLERELHREAGWLPADHAQS